MARRRGAEVINFERDGPPETIKQPTGGVGVDRVVDAVGVDAMHAHAGPAAEEARKKAGPREAAGKEVAPEQNPHDGNRVPGDTPNQVLDWAVQCVAKAGTIGIIGGYPPPTNTFPIGEAMNRKLSINPGNCNHRSYVPHLVELVHTGAVDPVRILTKVEPITIAIAAYGAVDKREPDWLTVELKPQVAAE